jgi:preprotein translocase subunit SecA
MDTGEEIVSILLDDFKNDKRLDETEALARLMIRLRENFNFSPDESIDWKSLTLDEWQTELLSFLKNDLEEKRNLVGEEQFNQFIRYEYLRNLDNRWQEHLENLDSLREAVYLRSYAQKNPLVEYKKEGFEILDAMMDDMRITLARKIFRVIVRNAPERSYTGKNRQPVHAVHSGLKSFAPGKSEERAEANSQTMQVRRSAAKVGRNDPCPCGSGKKYKNCHG